MELATTEVFATAVKVGDLLQYVKYAGGERLVRESAVTAVVEWSTSDDDLVEVTLADGHVFDVDANDSLFVARRD